MPQVHFHLNRMLVPEGQDPAEYLAQYAQKYLTKMADGIAKIFNEKVVNENELLTSTAFSLTIDWMPSNTLNCPMIKVEFINTNVLPQLKARKVSVSKPYAEGIKHAAHWYWCEVTNTTIMFDTVEVRFVVDGPEAIYL